MLKRYQGLSFLWIFDNKNKVAVHINLRWKTSEFFSASQKFQTRLQGVREKKYPF